MTFEKELPEWKEKGVKPPQSKLDEGWKVQDKPPAAWLNWQMNKTYEALKEVQEKAAEKTEVVSAIEDTKKYTDQKVAGIDLTKITPDSIGATKKTDFDTHTVDRTKHITADERNAWNAKETPGGAQEKANQAETNAKNYIDAKTWQKHKVASDDGTAIDISNRDLNSIVHTGFYKGTNMGNAPALLHGWGYVEVIAHAPGAWVLQKVYDLHADRFYMRRLQDNGWTAWTQDLFQSGVNNKQGLVDALNAVGVSASINEDWGTLIAKVRQTSFMRSVQINHESEIRASQGTFEPVATIPAGVKRIIFTTTGNSATHMYASYNNPTLQFDLKDSNGSYQNLVSNYYDSYYYRDVTLYSFMVDFTINTARSSYHVHEWNLANNEGIRISNAGEIQFGLYYFTNGYYNGKGTINGLLQYE